MAERPIFIPWSEGTHLVKEVAVSFVWNKGMAPSQKKKNIVALHAAAAKRGLSPLLEVSTKSDELVGQRLSAFSLKVQIGGTDLVPIECAFQGSKVFEHGGPYTDLYKVESREAKRDERLRASGNLVAFKFEGIEFPLMPKTAFYDWLYIKALYQHREYLRRLHVYAGFTDIEFNPERSINCQARSCAMFVALQKKGLLDISQDSPAEFIKILLPDSILQPHSVADRQQRLFTDISANNGFHSAADKAPRR